MATLPVINQCTRVAFYWHQVGTAATAVNVMHFQTASTDTLALKNALDANVVAAMWSQTLTTLSIFQLAITPLDGSSATQLYAVSGTKWAGTVASGDYSPASAVVVSLRTALRGRRNRGRVYLPFVAESAMAGGQTAGIITGMQTAWDGFRSAMKTASMPLVIASYGHSLHKHKNPDGSITLTPVTWAPDKNEVVATTVEAALGTMRPRQTRVRGG